eukprot:Lankesteria_metandrocarpae@DN2928_c0_g1_i1.p1
MRRCQLTDALICQFEEVVVYKECCKPANGCDWMLDGRHVVVSSDDDVVQVVKIEEPQTSVKVLVSRKHGCSFIRIARDCTSSLHAFIATKPVGSEQPAIRLWDLSGNRFLQAVCHMPSERRATWCGLTAHPSLPLVAASSNDGRVYITKLQGEANSKEEYNLGTIQSLGDVTRPVTAFDPTGAVLAVTVIAGCIHLFDMLSIQGGEFAVIDIVAAVRTAGLPPLSQRSNDTDLPRIAQIEFSPPNGALLIVVVETTPPRLFSLGAFSGRVLQEYKFEDGTHDGRAKGGVLSCGAVSVSADGKYLSCGGDDCGVHIWNLVTGAKVTTLIGHKSLPTITAFSPASTLLASADLDVALWACNIQ